MQDTTAVSTGPLSSPCQVLIEASTVPAIAAFKRARAIVPCAPKMCCKKRYLP